MYVVVALLLLLYYESKILPIPLEKHPNNALISPSVLLLLDWDSCGSTKLSLDPYRNLGDLGGE